MPALKMPHDMQFCSQCDNMLFIQTDPEGTHYHCQCCDKRVELFGSSSQRISHTVIKKRQGASGHSALTESVLGDPTLPVTGMIACPNAACNRGEKENRVAYINHDPTNMSFTYSCVHCKHVWALSNRGEA